MAGGMEQGEIVEPVTATMHAQTTWWVCHPVSTVMGAGSSGIGLSVAAAAPSGPKSASL